MPRSTRDPRSAAEREADEELLALFEQGKRLVVDPAVEAAAIAAVERAYRERREAAARLGLQLGLLRRARGLSQEAIARAVGTQKSNISRIESGRYGGLTIERFLAIEQAIRTLAGAADEGAEPRAMALIQEPILSRFRTPSDCLEVADP